MENIDIYITNDSNKIGLSSHILIDNNTQCPKA